MVPKWCPDGTWACQRHKKTTKNHKVAFGWAKFKRPRGFLSVFFGSGPFLGFPRGTKNRPKIEKMGAKNVIFWGLVPGSDFSSILGGKR